MTKQTQIDKQEVIATKLGKDIDPRDMFDEELSAEIRALDSRSFTLKHEWSKGWRERLRLNTATGADMARLRQLFNRRAVPASAPPITAWPHPSAKAGTQTRYTLQDAAGETECEACGSPLLIGSTVYEVGVEEGRAVYCSQYCAH